MSRKTKRVVQRVTDALIVGGVIPAWIAAGLLDWHFHRKTRIERTTGVPESALHLLMDVEALVPLTIALFCKSNKTSVGLAFGAALLHEFTAMSDVAYAFSHRAIPQSEDHTHSFLEVLPFVTAALAAARPFAKKEGLRLRRRRPSNTTLLCVYGAAALLAVAPHVEELIRCALARRDGDARNEPG